MEIKNCMRCNVDLTKVLHIMSFFNEDIICSDCKRVETMHPLFELARSEEITRVRKGEMNYKGIFAGQTYPFAQAVSDYLLGGGYLQELIMQYKGDRAEPLDGAAADQLTEVLRLLIYLTEGILSKDKFETKMAKVLVGIYDPGKE